MAVTKLDIIIPQSGTCRIVITVASGPGDLTDYSGEMQVRKIKASQDVLADVPPECFTMDNLNRQVVLQIPSALTATYEWDDLAVYDMYVVGPSGDRWRLVEGLARLSKTVTREA